MFNNWNKRKKKTTTINCDKFSWSEWCLHSILWAKFMHDPITGKFLELFCTSNQHSAYPSFTRCRECSNIFLNCENSFILTVLQQANTFWRFSEIKDRTWSGTTEVGTVIYILNSTGFKFNRYYLCNLFSFCILLMLVLKYWEGNYKLTKKVLVCAREYYQSKYKK